MPDWFGILERKAALRLLDKMQEFVEDSDLPPEIIKKRLAAIEAARKAELFILSLGRVDANLMNEATSRRNEYEKARAAWTNSQGHTLH